MKRHFEFNDDKSSKFWEIEEAGRSFTVTYGKIGSSGQNQTKEFGSEEECKKEAEKLIKEKLKKGYIEIKVDSSKKENKSNNYSKILNAKNQDELRKALCEHFAYLADTPGFEPILEAVMKEAVGAKMDGDNLVINFSGSDVLTACPPADLSKYEEWPESFKKCVLHHEYLSFPENGWALYLGDTGSFEYNYLEDVESELLEYEEILSPLTDYSDWWLYHPGKINSFGEPSICYFSHEGGDVEEPVPYKAGSFFLKRIADILELQIEIPDISENKTGLNEVKTWWDNLSDDWKTAIANLIDKKNDLTITEKDSKNILKITTFYCHDEKLSLKTFEPLTMLKKLTEINISCQKEITDISPLAALSNIKSISISDAQISNIDSIRNLIKLERLELTNMPISNIEPLSALNKLEQLDISQTKVTDLSSLKELPKLKKINLSGTAIDSLKDLKKLKKLRDINCSNTNVSDINILSSFKQLGMLNFNSTNISDLSPLDNVEGIYILHCDNSKITFQEIMKFISKHIKGYTDGLLGIDIYSAYLQKDEKFLESIENINFPLTSLGDVLSIWANDKTISFIKNKKIDMGERLIKAYIKHLPLDKSDFISQELFGNAMVLLTQINDAGLADQVIKKLMPEKITKSRVAFNMACFYSLKKDRENLLKYTKMALELGHEPERFRQDADFKEYQTDLDFAALLKAPQMPDPNENPMGWWNSLNENWKSEIGWEIGEPKNDEDIKKVFEIERYFSKEASNLEPLQYFTNLKDLNISYGKFKSIDPLQYLKNLERLTIEGDQYISKIKINNIEPLKELVLLKYLKITDQDFTDISPLINLVNIEDISLIRNPIKNIDPLRNMSKLKDFGILYCDVDNLEAIKKCTELERININKTKITNLEPLSNMKKLKKLYILNNQITDLSPLQDCSLIEFINFDKCPVTSLKPLENLPNLNEISLIGTKITEDEIKAFKKSHPKCKINKE